MIFVTDKGRLANNIFQYGHLYAWGREHGRTTMSMRFAYKYPDFQIAHTRHHHFLLYILAKYAAKLHLIPTVQFNIMNDPFLEQQKTMLNSKYVLATGWCVRFPDLFEKYKDEIISLFEFMPDVYICSNDPQLDKEQYSQQLRGTNVYFPCGTPAEDLCLLSECDYLIGPPSTFTLIASMYRDTPLYWMIDAQEHLRADSFHTFNYQARHFDEYFIPQN